MKIKDGFGKLLASGLVFTMAVQVFTVVGGITLVIPLTGLTMPFMAAGGSSLVANSILVTLLLVISNAANKPEPELTSDTFQYEALAVLRDHELKDLAKSAAEAEKRDEARRGRGLHAAHGEHADGDDETEAITPDQAGEHGDWGDWSGWQDDDASDPAETTSQLPADADEPNTAIPAVPDEPSGMGLGVPPAPPAPPAMGQRTAKGGAR